MCSPLKILRVADIPGGRTGGMSRAMFCSGDAMVAAGHRVDYLMRDEIGHQNWPKLRRFLTPLRLPQRILQLHRKHSYDVVEMHEPLAAPYCIARARGASLPPLVLFSHGLELRAHSAMLAYRRAHNLRVSLKQRISPLSITLQAAYAIRHSDQVMCGSQDDMSFLHRMGVSKARLTLVRLGVAGEFFREGEILARKASSRHGVLFVGTWLMRKGVVELANAMNAMMALDPELKLTTAGTGAPSADVLRYLKKEFHARITVISRLANDTELVEVYKRHALLVLPSYMEGQSLVMLEAAAMGLPIVATNTSGMRDFIGRFDRGLLVPIGDAVALAECLAHLLQSPETARKLGEAARVASRDYTWGRSASTMIQAYRRAIGRRR